MVERLKPRWIETGAGVLEVAEACSNAGRFAMDTEADSLHSYFHKVCLVQVTADGQHFLVDPLALSAEELQPLWSVVADPELPIVMHGADYDLRVLDRDFDVRVCGLQDTQIMAQLLGEARTGLGALLDDCFDTKLDKRFQRADWGRRPLPESYRDYAAADTAHVERLAARLRRRLEEKGRWAWAVADFERLEAVRFVPPDPDPLAFERIKGARGLEPEARDRLHALFLWREQRAQHADIPPFKVLGARPMVELAIEPPTERSGFSRVDGLGPRFARRWGGDLLRVLQRPGAAPPRGRRNRSEGPTPKVKARLKRMLAARDKVAAELGLEAGLLCSKAVATAVATLAGPSPGRNAMGSAGLSGWRLKLLADPFVEAWAE